MRPAIKRTLSDAHAAPVFSRRDRPTPLTNTTATARPPRRRRPFYRDVPADGSRRVVAVRWSRPGRTRYVPGHPFVTRFVLDAHGRTFFVFQAFVAQCRRLRIRGRSSRRGTREGQAGVPLRSSSTRIVYPFKRFRRSATCPNFFRSLILKWYRIFV